MNCHRVFSVGARAVLVAVGAMACAPYVPYLAPIESRVDVGNVDESTLVPYRKLAREDFKAHRPAELGEGNKHAAAATVVVFRSTPTRLVIHTESIGDSLFFVATVDTFRFEARFSQTQSWLDSKFKGQDAEGILRHEQIHFAIHEVEVRRANASIEAIRARIRGVGRTESDARAEARKRLQAERARIYKSMRERSTQFDKETANGQIAGYEDMWFTVIQRELAETAPHPRHDTGWGTRK